MHGINSGKDQISRSSCLRSSSLWSTWRAISITSRRALYSSIRISSGAAKRIPSRLPLGLAHLSKSWKKTSKSKKIIFDQKIRPSKWLEKLSKCKQINYFGDFSFSENYFWSKNPSIGIFHVKQKENEIFKHCVFISLSFDIFCHVVDFTRQV